MFDFKYTAYIRVVVVVQNILKLYRDTSISKYNTFRISSIKNFSEIFSGISTHTGNIISSCITRYFSSKFIRGRSHQLQNKCKLIDVYIHKHLQFIKKPSKSSYRTIKVESLRSVPGNRGLDVNISAIMHPTDQMSTIHVDKLGYTSISKVDRYEVYFIFNHARQNIN